MQLRACKQLSSHQAVAIPAASAPRTPPASGATTTTPMAAAAPAVPSGKPAPQECITLTLEQAVELVWAAAAASSSAEALQAVLAAGIDVNSSDGEGATAIHQAALAGDVDTLQILISAGADVNAVHSRAEDGRGIRPLHHACNAGHTAVVAALLAAGAHVHPQTPRYMQPIHLAACNG